MPCKVPHWVRQSVLLAIHIFGKTRNIIFYKNIYPVPPEVYKILKLPSPFPHQHPTPLRTLPALNKQTNTLSTETWGSVNSATVVVPRGAWRTGSINLTSHLEFRLEAGAHVLSTNNEAWYRQVPCLPNESREPIRNQGFISGWNMTRTSITGAGPALSTIDGNGPVWNNYTADHKDQVHAHKYARPFLINPMWSTEFSVTNVTLKDSAFWTMTPFGCDGIYMADVNITSANSAGNTDGTEGVTTLSPHLPLFPSPSSRQQ